MKLFKFIFKLGLTGWILFGLFNIFVGGWSIIYIGSIVGFAIPFIAAMVIGLFTAQVTVPIAIILFVLKCLCIL